MDIIRYFSLCYISVPPTGQEDCPLGTIFQSCGSMCPPTCETPNPMMCTFGCNRACFCPEGELLTEDGDCVKPEDCPSYGMCLYIMWPVT